MGKRKLQALRRLAAHEQGGRCAYCGQPMGPAEDCRRTSETADHVVPVKLCNTRKGATVGRASVAA